MKDPMSIEPQRPLILDARVRVPAPELDVPPLDRARQASGTLNAPMVADDRSRRLAGIAADALAESRRAAAMGEMPPLSVPLKWRVGGNVERERQRIRDRAEARRARKAEVAP